MGSAEIYTAGIGFPDGSAERWPLIVTLARASLSGMQVKQREDRAIEQFRLRLGAIEEQPVRLIGRPDRDAPGRGGCDAIIERGGKRLALEHTTIDSYRDQREDNHRFSKVVVPLEHNIGVAFPDSWIEISVPARAVPAGASWRQIETALSDGLAREIEKMPFEDAVRQLELPGVPFPVWVSREAGEPSGCFVMRQSPRDIVAELEGRISQALRAKNKQLEPYHTQGLGTILLLDSDEVALVNRRSLAQAFASVAKPSVVGSIDEVYIAETAREPIWIFPIKLNNRTYPSVREFECFRRRQYALTYRD